MIELCVLAMITVPSNPTLQSLFGDQQSFVVKTRRRSNRKRDELFAMHFQRQITRVVVQVGDFVRDVHTLGRMN